MNIKKGIAYVFMATGIGFVISLLTSFVLPKFLSVETYADIKLYQLYITYVGILHLGFSDGMYLRLGGKKIEELNKSELVSEFNTFKVFQLLINIVVLIVAVLLKDIVLIAVAVSILPVNIINYLRNLYQATGLYDLYSKFLTLNNVMLFVLNMILLFVVKTDNPNIYIVGNVIVYFINWAIIETVIRFKIFRKQKGRINYHYLVEDIRDGFLLMIGNFCSVIFTSIDRMFSKYLLGTYKFAYYSFAVSVEGLLNVFITPISVTMYNYLCINNIPEKIKKIKGILLVGVSVIITSAFPVKWVISNFITKYQESSNIIFLLFAAQFFSIIVKCIHTNLYKAEKRQKQYFIIIASVTVIAAILDTISYQVSKTNEGFATATLITSIIWFIIGEFNFKDSKYSLREYAFMGIVVITYLVTGLCINSAVVGCIIYVIVTGICIVTIMRKEFIYLLGEGKSTLGKLKGRFAR